jgi:hypothetical protein
MKTKRIHGKSRLEVALEKSIANELKIRSLRKDLCALSLEFAQFRMATVPLVKDTVKVTLQPTISGPLKPSHWEVWKAGDSEPEIWPYRPPGVYS